MVLTSVEISSKGIVTNAVVIAQRPTTYDATVGCIIERGSEIKAESYKLPPRGIVWVISAEIFNLPNDVTGLATLRTTWTHEGVLTLNVGVVDPGWHGPLAAMLVNFGNSDFTVSKGDPFLRIMFHTHKKVTAPPVVRDMATYKREITTKSRMFSNTFLNMDSLVSEVSEKIFSLPRLAVILTLFGILLALLAIFTPIAYSVYFDYEMGSAKVEALQKQLDDLKAAGVADTGKRLSTLESRVDELKRASTPAPVKPAELGPPAPSKPNGN
ncbi:hypothetical protein LB526_21950 [Mesorhizobium sp. CA6]|uniref:dCTP deaminase domain-containing protein n=1 Tax=Mesorhizobium sp. CA6 TaxID=588500 RepID=UPI001CCAE799|nr:hypothetical protein [Mesorhizobium sp. CA6]MBZ9769428.1 hypothetical protein [Mesorhizobium sp. CA6]